MDVQYLQILVGSPVVSNLKNSTGYSKTEAVSPLYPDITNMFPTSPMVLWPSKCDEMHSGQRHLAQICIWLQQ